MLEGGFGSAVLEYAALHDTDARIVPMGVADCFVQHGDHQHLLEDVGLDDTSLAKRILSVLTKEDMPNG